MQHDDLVYLGHMLDRAKRVGSFLRGIPKQDFDEDESLRLSIRHLIQTIGEAARHLSQDTRDAHPEIPWSKILGMRNRIVHDYIDIDDDIVWQTAMQGIPELINALEPIVPAQYRLPLKC